MDKFENKLKSKLLDKNMELDTDQLWDDVYPHIKKKKRRFIIFYFLGFLMLATLGSLLYYGQGNKLSFKTDQDYALQTELTSNQDQIVPPKSIVNDEEPLIKKDEKQTTKKISIENTNEEEVQRSQNDTPIANQRKVSESKASSLINIALETEDNLNLIKLKNEQTLNKEIEKQLELNTEKENSSQEYEYLKLKPLVSQFDDLKFQDRILTKTPRNEFQSNYRSQKSNFSLFGALGGSMVNKQLATRDGLSSEHLQRRLSNEKSLESIDASLGLNYEIQENFEISLGLNFRRINEKISDTYTRVDTILLENVIIENIISSRGTEAVYGDVLASRTIETNLEAYNRYNELSAFADFRYFLGIQNWRPFASLGYQQSLYSSQSGYWLWDEQLYDLSEDNENYISSSFSPAIRFGLGLDFNFSEDASIRFESRFLKYLNSISTDSYPLTQKYTLIGLQTGLNIKL